MLVKISEFCDLCKVTKDTVHYYVEKGLLIPIVSGKSICYSEQDYADFQYIQKLKKIGFTVKEISSMLAIRRTTTMLSPTTLSNYCTMLEAKKKSLLDHQKALSESISKLESDIKEIKSRRMKSIRLGVPLSAISLLACPVCGGNLVLSNASLSSQYVFDGVLSCSCGYEVSIENGVIITQNRYIGKYDHPTSEGDGYYDGVSDDFIIHYQKCHNYIQEHIKKIESLKHKVILEANVNGYFFLVKHFFELEKDCIYIITDKFKETINSFKRTIEYMNLDINIVFIADASTNFPLVSGCVDLFIDFFGEGEYFLYHQNSFIEDAARLFKPKMQVFGADMYYENNSKSKTLVPLRYPECSLKAYSRNGVIDAYHKTGFDIEMTHIGKMTKTYCKDRYCCHVDGEYLYLDCFVAMRGK